MQFSNPFSGCDFIGGGSPNITLTILVVLAGAGGVLLVVLGAWLVVVGTLLVVVATTLVVVTIWLVVGVLVMTGSWLVVPPPPPQACIAVMVTTITAMTILVFNLTS